MHADGMHSEPAYPAAVVEGARTMDGVVRPYIRANRERCVAELKPQSACCAQRSGTPEDSMHDVNLRPSWKILARSLLFYVGLMRKDVQ